MRKPIKFKFLIVLHGISSLVNGYVNLELHAVNLIGTINIVHPNDIRT
jgi:hypothetical protein